MRAQPSVTKASWTSAAFGLPDLATTTLFSGDDFRNGRRTRACARLGLTRYSQPLPLGGFQTFSDTLRSGRRRIHETTIERQDASAIHRLTPGRAKTIATVRELVNEHIPRGYDEC